LKWPMLARIAVVMTAGSLAHAAYPAYILNLSNKDLSLVVQKPVGGTVIIPSTWALYLHDKIAHLPLTERAVISLPRASCIMFEAATDSKESFLLYAGFTVRDTNGRMQTKTSISYEAQDGKGQFSTVGGSDETKSQVQIDWSGDRSVLILRDR